MLNKILIVLIKKKLIMPFSFRVIGLGSLVPSVQEHVFSMGTIAQTYQQIYIDMLHCRPVTCAWTGTIHPAWNVKPTLVITDVRRVINSVSRSEIQILPRSALTSLQM